MKDRLETVKLFSEKTSDVGNGVLVSLVNRNRGNTQITTIPLTGDLSKFTFLQEKKGRKNLVALKYRESQSLEVDLNDLIYFKAKLKNTQED